MKIQSKAEQLVGTVVGQPVNLTTDELLELGGVLVGQVALDAVAVEAVAHSHPLGLDALGGEAEGEGHIIYTGFEDMGDVASALEATLGEAESVNPTWKPQNTIPVGEDKAGTLMKLIAALEDDDDVQNVYSNFEIDDEVMASLS